MTSGPEAAPVVTELDGSEEMGTSPFHTPVVDSHIHVASDDEQAYPRRPSGLGSDWWRRGGYGATRVLATLARCGVARMVVVQASGLYQHDNSYVIDVAARWPDQVRTVVAIDPDGASPGQAVADAVGSPGVAGVRCFAVHPSSTWIGTSRADEIFAAASAGDVTIVLVVFPGGLETLSPVIDRYPSARVVIDHCGFPDLDRGTLPAGSPLLTMAVHPQVTVKLTSHNLVHLREVGDPPTDLVRQLMEHFGPSRLIWGSDYPQTAHRSYPSLAELAGSAFAELAPGEIAAITGGNASRLFDFPVVPPDRG
jgi:predicted TIM-barrel fold metal-dependent hydrolase